jgi:hypothetical protein
VRPIPSVRSIRVLGKTLVAIQIQIKQECGCFSQAQRVRRLNTAHVTKNYKNLYLDQRFNKRVANIRTEWEWRDVDGVSFAIILGKTDEAGGLACWSKTELG